MTDPYLRRATTEDVDLLFRWANDSTTRENAFSTQKIAYADHVKWFAEKINADNSVLFIYCQDRVPIGQARIDIEGDLGIISYSIDSAYRLHGHGGRLLALLEAVVLSDFPNVKLLVGRVKKTNIASQRKFEQLMYEKKEKDTHFEYYKAPAPLSAHELPIISGGGGNFSYK
jgi:RimJ/RimL family protein N-acetyltransferase